MSMKTVAAAIKAATAENNPNGPQFVTPHVDAKEAMSIVEAARYGKDGKRKTPVTKGEIGKIVDLFDRRPAPRTGDMVTLMVPENPGAVTFGQAATDTVKAFLGNHGVQHVEVIKDRVRDAVAEGLGTPLKVPPNVTGLTGVLVSDTRRMDGNREQAYVDLDTGKFFLLVTQSGFVPPAHVTGPKWYGPMELASTREYVNIATREKLVDALAKISEADWTAGTHSLPTDKRFEAVPITDFGGFDNFNITAYVPKPDVNEAGHAYLMRTGGFAGVRQVVRVHLSGAFGAALQGNGQGPDIRPGQ